VADDDTTLSQRDVAAKDGDGQSSPEGVSRYVIIGAAAGSLMLLAFGVVVTVFILKRR